MNYSVQTLALLIAEVDFKEAVAIGTLVAMSAAVAWFVGYMIRNYAQLAAGGDAHRLMKAAQQASMEGDFATALERLHEAEAKDSNVTRGEDTQRWSASLCLAAGAGKEGVDRIRRLLAPIPPDTIHFPFLVDEFCTGALTYHAIDAYPEAEKLIRQAIEASPHEATLKGTLASILFELGRAAEALPLLQALNDSAEDAINVGLSAAYLSAIAAKHGDSDQAARYRDRALDHLPDHPIARRVLGMS
jgi:tetratricopeptide (TPR) repeat protein